MLKNLMNQKDNDFRFESDISLRFNHIFIKMFCFLGSGRVFWLLDQPVVMFTCILSIISSLKQSK